jgi:hypothetical protein
VAAVRNPSTKVALARDEQVLCEQATTLSFDQYAKAVSYWHQFADPDGVETSHEKRLAARDVYLEQSFGEMWLGHLTMDPLSGAVVSEELERLEHELFEPEWAEVKARLGREPTVSDLERTPGQRRCDALAEMAKRSRTAPAGGRRPAPLVTVLVDFPTALAGRICELANGTVLPPGALLSLLDEAYIERAVFSPDKRVEVSETARLFTGATKRPSSSGTGPAPTPTATGHDPPRSTTSSPTPRVAPPTRRTTGFCAASTTGSGTSGRRHRGEATTRDLVNRSPDAPTA